MGNTSIILAGIAPNSRIGLFISVMGGDGITVRCHCIMGIMNAIVRSVRISVGGRLCAGSCTRA